MAIKVKPRGTRAEGATNALEVSVSELSARLKRTVEDEFGSVRIRGEISGYRGPHSSGHSYFKLKDDRAVIDAIVWRGAASKLGTRPQEGLEVIASGKLTTYPNRSSYQIVIDRLEPAGEGALMAQLDRLRRKLAEEGLFAAERKRALPFMPRVIGVVTSPTGAVIRDILHRIADRFPVHVVVWPVRVQGETTGEEVARAVMGFSRTDGSVVPRPDVLIVARGGGSLEDLWGFNDELVVRAVAAATLPVISAVGHETDTTLIDHVADHRAPTPTAAAERAVPVRAELEAHVANLDARLRGAVGRALDNRRAALRAAARALPSPDMALALPRRRLDEAGGRLVRGLERRTDRARAGYERVSARSTPQRLKQSLRVRADLLRRADAPRERAFVRLRQRLGERLLLAARAHGVAVATDRRSRRRDLALVQRGLRIEPVRAGVKRAGERLGRSASRFERASTTGLDTVRARLGAAERLLESLSFKGVLARGYAVLRDGEGRPLSGVVALGPGDAFSAQMSDGTVEATVNGEASRAEGRRAKKQPKKAKPTMAAEPVATAPPAEEQTSLF